MWCTYAFLLAFGAAQPNPFLEQAKRLYAQLEYEQCLEQLSEAQDWPDSSATELVDIEIFGGLCQFQLGDRREAEKFFTRALQREASAKLPPHTSPKIAEYFRSLKKRTLASPPDRPVAATADRTEASTQVDLPSVKAPVRRETPDRPAAPEEEPVVALTLTPSANSPPEAHVNQPAASMTFSSRHKGTLALAGGALFATAVGVGFGVTARNSERQANVATFESDGYALGDRARKQAAIANTSYGVAAVAAVGAVAAYFIERR